MYFTGSFNLLKSPQLLIYKGILLKPLSYKRHEPQAPTSASEVSGDVFGGGEGMGEMGEQLETEEREFFKESVSHSHRWKILIGHFSMCSASQPLSPPFSFSKFNLL